METVAVLPIRLMFSDRSNIGINAVKLPRKTVHTMSVFDPGVKTKEEKMNTLYQ